MEWLKIYRYCDKAFILIIDSTIEVIVFTIMTDKIRLMRKDIFPLIFTLDQRLSLPDGPMLRVSGIGEGVVGTLITLETEEKHYIDIIDQDNLRITGGSLWINEHIALV